MKKAYIFVLILFFLLPIFAHSQTAEEAVFYRRAELEKELTKLEGEIKVQETILGEKRKESQSLERDIAIFDADIRKSELSIRARELSISKLSQDIIGKEDTVESLDEKLKKERRSLAQLLRKRYEIDSFSLVEVILSNKNLSEFFKDVDTFSSISSALENSFEEIEKTKTTTNKEKESLVVERRDEIELKNIQVLERKKIEKKKMEKNQILKLTKGVEDVYRQILKEKQKSAAEIRTELFTLRGSTAIPFGKALEYADFASQKTGVRPAFILGVIAEESNLGANVGTGNWKSDMHPTRDRPIFKVITTTLGLNPDQMPVSKKPWYGWGGAMGPAQFIPSTWVYFGGYNKNSNGIWEYNKNDDIIRKLLESDSPSNPWDPKAAFMASASLLEDNGASKGTWSAERLAALRYFAGWNNAKKSSYAFYGDEVMDLANKYQKQIDILNQ